MRKLIVALIVLTPFIGVGQSGKDSSLKSIQFSHCDSNITCGIGLFMDNHSDFKIVPYKSDTLRVVMLVTSKHMGVAYQKDGYIVWNNDLEVTYLDLNKRVIKNLKIWNYQRINPTSGKASKN